MKRSYLQIILNVFVSSLFILLAYYPSQAADEPNEIYQWQIQKYPKTQKEFKDIVADQSVIKEKPAGISKKYRDEARIKEIEAKKKAIEESEKAEEAERLTAKNAGKKDSASSDEIVNAESPESVNNETNYTETGNQMTEGDSSTSTMEDVEDTAGYGNKETNEWYSPDEGSSTAPSSSSDGY